MIGSRRSLRARLTALFALGAALLVTAGGLLLVVDQRRNSDVVVTKSLRTRIDRIAEVISQDGKLPVTESYAQVITQFGRVKDLTPVLANDLLLTDDQVQFVFREGQLQIDRILPAVGGKGRILAQRRVIGGSPILIVVGSSLAEEDDARRRLLVTLALGGPALTALLGFGGWLLAGAALRPVRTMTDQAGEITRADTGARLPIPPSDDEIAHLGRTLNAMLDRLEQSFRRERSFVDDASHELRTPLTVLRGEMELALLHPGDAAETRETLKRSIVEVDRLSALADDLLVLARAGQTPSSSSPAAAEVTVREAVSAFRSASAGHSAGPVGRAEAGVSRPTVSFHVAPTVSPTTEVALSPERLRRVLVNLLANAHRFAQHEIVVELSTVDMSAAGTGTEDTSAPGIPWLRLVVSDDGPGFPEDFLPKAFERFAVPDAARTRSATSGTGLGLAIVRAIVEQAGGTVTARNAEPPAHGAIVELRLPIV